MALDEGGLWWRKPLRVVQPNLQIRDTARIDPERLADQLKELGANTIVFNVGGIYAWYPSDIPYHVRNEYLDDAGDLLRAAIDACRKRELRFVARFDFGKAEDSVYLRRPEWFVRRPDGSPAHIGVLRPGKWPLLLHTCINGGYRGEEVAAAVLREVMERYPIDGVFLNAPNYTACHCEVCRSKYRAVYGEPLPDDPARFAPDWAVRCYRDNLSLLRAAIKERHPDMPLILYYQLTKEESVLDRSPLADIMCTEPHDALSAGVDLLSAWGKPALSIKLGRSTEALPYPFGIVHTSPGMDWRHTGLPPAEHRFWLAQVPANGGHVWHSLTGIPDTISDRRILRSVADTNAAAARVAPYMDGAAPVREAALVWDDSPASDGLADALLRRHVQFDLLLPGHLPRVDLARYGAIVVPGGTMLTGEQAQALAGYAQAGGRLVLDGRLPEAADRPDEAGPSQATGAAAAGAADGTGGWQRMLRLAGGQRSEELAAAYIRLEGAGNPLARGLEETPLLPLRGRVTYYRADGDADVLATLVPPFSPLESVGAPPERASLPAERTDIPLAMRIACGRGSVLLLAFPLGAMLRQYGLPEHRLLLANAVAAPTGAGRPVVELAGGEEVQASVFEKDGGYLVHLVNGVGRRPLAACAALRDVVATVRLPTGRTASRVRPLLSAGDNISWEMRADGVRITLDLRGTWECIHVETVAVSEGAPSKAAAARGGLAEA